MIFARELTALQAEHAPALTLLGGRYVDLRCRCHGCHRPLPYRPEEQRYCHACMDRWSRPAVGSPADVVARVVAVLEAPQREAN